jgi:hypothetical protein
MPLPQADKEAAVESTVAALESRCARLASELEDAAVALEVCKAKAGMYDELQAKAERLVSGRGLLRCGWQGRMQQLLLCLQEVVLQGVL